MRSLETFRRQKRNILTTAGLAAGVALASGCTSEQAQLASALLPCNDLVAAEGGDSASIRNVQRVTIPSSFAGQEITVCFPMIAPAETPKPTPSPSPAPVITEQQFKEFIKENHPKTAFKKAQRTVLKIYSADPESLPIYQGYFSENPKIELNRCKTGYEDGKVHGNIDEAEVARKIGCADVAIALVYMWGKTNNPAYYDGFQDFFNYVVTDKMLNGKGSTFKSQLTATVNEYFDLYVH